MLRGHKELLGRIENCADLLKAEIAKVARATVAEAPGSGETIRYWDKIKAGEKVEIGAILAVHIWEALRLAEGLIVMEDMR